MIECQTALERAIAKCRQEWTSLPGADEARYSMARAQQILAANGAIFEGNMTA